MLSASAEAFGGSYQERNSFRQTVTINKIIRIFLNDLNNEVRVTKGQLVSCFALSKRPVERELYVPDGDVNKPKEVRVTAFIQKADTRLSPFT